MGVSYACASIRSHIQPYAVGQILAYPSCGGLQDWRQRAFDVHSGNQSTRLVARMRRVQKGHTVTHIVRCVVRWDPPPLRCMEHVSLLLLFHRSHSPNTNHSFTGHKPFIHWTQTIQSLNTNTKRIESEMFSSHCEETSSAPEVNVLVHRS